MPASSARIALGRAIFRRAAAQTRPQAWKQVGRRGYASAEHAKKSSDLPWYVLESRQRTILIDWSRMIGSAGVTIPAAIWLMGQGPTKTPHHDEHHAEHHDDKDEEGEEEEPKEAREAIQGETAPSQKHVGQEKSATADVSSSPKDHIPEGNERGVYNQDKEPEEKNTKKDTQGEGKESGAVNKQGDKEDKRAEEAGESGEGENADDKKNHKGANAVEPKAADKADQDKGGDDKQSDESSDDSSSDADDGKDTPATSDDERPKDKDGYELPGPNAPKQINWSSSSKKGPGEQQKGPRKPSETAGEKQVSESDWITCDMLI